MLSIKQETLKRIDGLNDFREGAFVNYRDGLYHLTYSIDDTGSENYRVGYATATSVDGPWTYRGVILQKDPNSGHPRHRAQLDPQRARNRRLVHRRTTASRCRAATASTARPRSTSSTFDAETGLITSVTPTLGSVPGQTIVDPHPLVVTIDGVARVGETLEATIGDAWTASGYRWTRDGADIPDADGAQYQLTEADEGSLIAVVVDAEKALWNPAVASAEVGPVVAVDEEPVPAVTAIVSGGEPNAAGWRSGAVSLALSLNEGAEAIIEYRLGADDWSTYVGAIAIAEGESVVEYRATVDGAPVVGSGGTLTLKVDSIAPESTAVLDPGDRVGTPTRPSPSTSRRRMQPRALC